MKSSSCSATNFQCFWHATFLCYPAYCTSRCWRKRNMWAPCRYEQVCFRYITLRDTGFLFLIGTQRSAFSLSWLTLARTIYTVFVLLGWHNIHTVIFGVYLRFWPPLVMICDEELLSSDQNTTFGSKLVKQILQVGRQDCTCTAEWSIIEVE
jgi:hypothetical protein